MAQVPAPLRTRTLTYPYVCRVCDLTDPLALQRGLVNCHWPFVALSRPFFCVEPDPPVSVLVFGFGQ